MRQLDALCLLSKYLNFMTKDKTFGPNYTLLIYVSLVERCNSGRVCVKLLWVVNGLYEPISMVIPTQYLLVQ